MITYDIINEVMIIKLEKRATMQESIQVSSLLEKADKSPIIDFSDVEYIDSTFLGLVAKFTMLFKQKNGNYLNVLKPSNQVLDSLNKTGILKFLVVLDKEILINGKSFENVSVDKEQMAKHILELHKVLITINEDNKKEFEAVVKQMEKVINK